MSGYYQCNCLKSFPSSLARDAHIAECPLMIATAENTNLRAEISRLTGERDAVKKILNSICDGWDKPSEILFSRDAGQRKAGALWALEELGLTAKANRFSVVHAALIVEMQDDIKRGLYNDAIKNEKVKP
jgi:hypothetical protein